MTTKTPRALEQLLTSQRTTSGGYHGPDGRFVWQEPSRNKAPNVLTPGNLASGGVWSGVVCPDGSLKAVELNPQSGSSPAEHRTTMSLAGASDQRCQSCYIRASEFRYIYIVTALGATGWGTLIGDTLTGEIVRQDPTFERAVFEPAGDGWWRIGGSGDGAYGSAHSSIFGACDDDGAARTSVPKMRTCQFFGYQAEDSDYPTAYMDPLYGPRVDWRDGARLGILAEEASTNIAIESEMRNGLVANVPFRGGSVSDAPFAGLTEGTGVQVGPTAAATPTSYAYVSAAIAASTQYTFSCYVDAVGGPPLTSELSLNIGNSASAFNVEHIYGDRYRLWATLTSIASPAQYCGVFQTPDKARGFVVSGYQLELGDTMSSYIPTQSSQVTRGSDDQFIRGKMIDRTFNLEEGTLFVSARQNKPPGGLSSNDLYYLGVSGGGDYYRAYRYTTQHGAGHVVGGSTQVGLYASTSAYSAAQEDVKLAYSYAANAFTLSVDGSSVVDTSGSLPAFDTFWIGGATEGNVHIKDIRYFDKKLSDDALNILTAP